MDLKTLLGFLTANGCDALYAKELSGNDNSKNQIYLGGSFAALNMFPVKSVGVSDVNTSGTTSQKPKASGDTLWAPVYLSWLIDDGTAHLAPNARLILYPQYPEIRLGSVLAGCKNAPAKLIAPHPGVDGRYLFLGVNTTTGHIYAYVVPPSNQLIAEYLASPALQQVGVFSRLDISITATVSNRAQLIAALKAIHQKGAIAGKRLTAAGPVPSDAQQAGGYTLEAELGILPNSKSEPDFLGFEVKSFSIDKPGQFANEVLTLMTPEPDRGYYHDNGVGDFIRKYGYADKSGIADRFNFGGIYRAGATHPTTNLTLQITGYDPASGKLTDPSGMIALVDAQGNIAAGWSHTKLLKHWADKHERAVYVPYVKQASPRAFTYSNLVTICDGTDYLFFLQQVNAGKVYLDPAPKLWLEDGKWKTKARNQFRTKAVDLPALYTNSGVVDTLTA